MFVLGRSICYASQCGFIGNTLRLLSTSQDTIFSLSSGHGKCGVAVVRVSGSKSLTAVQSLAKFNDPILPRHAYLKKFHHFQTNDFIDKGLVLWFPGPNSFTGEDSCEFQVHGGPAVVSAMLDCLNAMDGLRPALPGEFTKRAFYSAKLDLTEVEGLADLIHAETECQRKQAVLQANGSLSKLYKDWSSVLLKCTAHIEAYIDFSEDQHIEDSVFDDLRAKLSELEDNISAHLDDGRKGELLRHGVRTVILGAPNVGKSSFMNHVCCKPISIVTDIAGTTRDIIETTFNISGYPVIFADTAGLRQNTSDIVETEGISRAINYASGSDLIILIMDAVKLKQLNYDLSAYYSGYVEELGVAHLITPDTRKIILMNKCDLIDMRNIKRTEQPYCIYISCTSGSGITEAINEITSNLKILCGSPSAECPTLSQQRHRQQLEICLQYLRRLKELSLTGADQDLAILAHQLRMALVSIGRITGAVSVEDILDVVFKDFCIGK